MFKETTGSSDQKIEKSWQRETKDEIKNLVVKAERLARVILNLGEKRWNLFKTDPNSVEKSNALNEEIQSLAKQFNEIIAGAAKIDSLLINDTMVHPADRTDILSSGPMHGSMSVSQAIYKTVESLLSGEVPQEERTFDVKRSKEEQIKRNIQGHKTSEAIKIFEEIKKI